MTLVLRIARKSLANRWSTALLTVLSIALSVMLLLGVEKVRTSARASFSDTISDTDLIVGARSGAVQLLLYAVFRIGNATANITWQTFEDLAAQPEVAWIVPLSLGDSHHGFRVLGTTPNYFEHYRYRHGQGLRFEAGGRFADLFDAVLGADVAQGLATGSAIRSSSRMAWATPRSRCTTTSRSASPGSSPRPARLSTGPCTSAWTRSRRSMSTGRAARAFRVRP